LAMRWKQVDRQMAQSAPNVQRVARLTAMLTVCLAVIAEVALRMPAVQAALPLPRLWYSEILDKKLRDMTTLESGQGVDVLFVGSSEVLRGIDPEVFDTEVERLTDKQVISYNAGVMGFSAVSTSAFTQTVFTEITSPSVIVYGVGPRDMNANSRKRRAQDREVVSTPMAAAYMDNSLLGRAQRLLLNNWYLYRYSSALELALSDWLGRPYKRDDVSFISQRGFWTEKGRRLDDVIPSGERSKYLNDIEHFAVGGKPVKALVDMMDYCDTNGFRLVIYNMPQHVYVYDLFSGGRAEYDAYVRTIRTLADEHGTEFIDMQMVVDEGQIERDDFCNLNHLNSHGAQRLSALLAQEMVARGLVP
jgi:hypothetical protein